MSMKAQATATKQRDGLFSLPAEGKQAGNAQTPSQAPPGCMRFPSFMPLCGSHGVAHPTQERRSPCSARLGEEQTATTGLESAAQGLDAVELG